MPSAYGVLGHGLLHTLSPYIHKKLFESSGICASYTVEDTVLEPLESYRSLLLKYDGLNVTIPHKQTVIPFMDSLDKSALTAGAVNCIKRSGTSLTGYSTDGYGFLKALEKKNFPVPGNIVLLGCGGAARTLIGALSESCENITVVCRPESLEKANRMIGCLQSEKCRIKAVTYGNAVGKYGLLVNATPLGMYPDTGSILVSTDVIENSDAVFDLVYNPLETKLLSTAKKLGKKCFGGMDMLVYQAVKAHEIWYGGVFSDSFISKLIEKAEFEVGKTGE